MSEEYQGGSTMLPLENPDAFLRQLEQNRMPTPGEPVQPEYRQTVGPDLDQFLANPEQGSTTLDGSPEAVDRVCSEMTPRQSPSKAIARKKYALVGNGPKVQNNPRHVQTRSQPIYDALNPPPPGWRPPRPKTRKLKGFF